MKQLEKLGTFTQGSYTAPRANALNIEVEMPILSGSTPTPVFGGNFNGHTNMEDFNDGGSIGGF